MSAELSSPLNLAEDLACGLDPVTFARVRLGFRPEGWQIRALRWKGDRLLLNCHRQSGKSTVAAILAVHEALYESRSLTLLVSPSLRQSSELFRKVVGFLRRLDPQVPLVEENRLSLETATGSRIVSLPSSESTIRGYSGASLIIEDEAARVPDDLHFAVRPMLAASQGRLILMSTPFGKRGHFWEAWAHGGPVWERIEAPATSCPWISREFLEEERRAMGERRFAEEYLCQFLDAEHQLFEHDLVQGAVTSSVRPLWGREECKGSS